MVPSTMGKAPSLSVVFYVFFFKEIGWKRRCLSLGYVLVGFFEISS